jgi:hypothetical protein
MKTYTITLANLRGYEHPAPERTAMKCISWDYICQVWPNRESMARSIRMQQKRAPRRGDWTAIVPLKDGEGY